MVLWNFASIPKSWKMTRPTMVFMVSNIFVLCSLVLHSNYTGIISKLKTPLSDLTYGPFFLSVCYTNKNVFTEPSTCRYFATIFFEKSSFPPLGASGRQVSAENNEFLKNHISCLKRNSIFFELSFPPLGASGRQVIAKNNEFLKNHISCLIISAVASFHTPMRSFWLTFFVFWHFPSNLPTTVEMMIGRPTSQFPVSYWSILITCMYIIKMCISFQLPVPKNRKDFSGKSPWFLFCWFLDHCENENYIKMRETQKLGFGYHAPSIGYTV
jgi:hypothetical protein